MCFVYLFAKQYTMLKRKGAISGFPVSQNIAEPLWESKPSSDLLLFTGSNTSFCQKLS